MPNTIINTVCPVCKAVQVIEVSSIRGEGMFDTKYANFTLNGGTITYGLALPKCREKTCKTEIMPIHAPSLKHLTDLVCFNMGMVPTASYTEEMPHRYDYGDVTVYLSKCENGWFVCHYHY